ncbi:MAG: hypothetical protein AAFZ11_00865 [Pseudomonadota bacterium]
MSAFHTLRTIARALDAFEAQRPALANGLFLCVALPTLWACGCAFLIMFGE